MSFDKMAPYLQDPLVLAGFALFLFFGLGRTLIRSGLLPQQNQEGGYRLLQRILLYGFVLSIAVVLLGFGLKYKDLSKREQRAAALLILNELKADRAIAGDLAANTETSLRNTVIVADAVRTQASPLLRLLFPSRNLEPAGDTPSPNVMANEQLGQAIAAKLPEQQTELNRMNAVAKAIRQTLAQTRATMLSLADEDGHRYRMERGAWTANAPIVRRISVVDLTTLEQTYAQFERARSDYDVMMRYDVTYLDALAKFLTFEGNQLTDENLAEVLAAERLYFQAAVTYGRKIADDLEQSGKAIDDLSARIAKV